MQLAAVAQRARPGSWQYVSRAWMGCEPWFYRADGFAGAWHAARRPSLSCRAFGKTGWGRWRGARAGALQAARLSGTRSTRLPSSSWVAQISANSRTGSSPCFINQFGKPTDSVITPDHCLGRILPIGRKMTRPTTLSLTDCSGTPHECVAEAFDTTHNVTVLLYPVKALGKPTIILPPGFKKVV